MGRRDIRENSNSKGKKLNIGKVFIVLVLILIIVFATKQLLLERGTNKAEKKSSKKSSTTEVVEEEQEVVKTVEEVAEEFGAEITEKIKDDTCYATKEGKEYTIYADGEVTEGKITIWQGDSTEPKTNEDGSIDITTASELKWISDQVSSGQKTFAGLTINLKANIDLGARVDANGKWEGTKWTPIIGFLESKTEESENTNTVENAQEAVQDTENVNVTTENLKRFAGTFNGNGFSIRGMLVESDSKYQGLFGYSSGTIENLTIKHSKVKGSTAVGAFAGLNEGNINTCYAQDVHVEGEEKIGIFAGISMTSSNINYCSVVDTKSTVSGNRYVGGLIGYMNNNVMLVNSQNKASVTGKDFTGGLVGIAFYGATISNSNNYALNVKGEKYVGGIVGYSQAFIEKVNNHDVYEHRGIISGTKYVGGLVGLNYEMGNITQSYNYCDVTASEDNLGGVVGLNNGSVMQVYNMGKVDATNIQGQKAGGIAGQNVSNSSIASSYNAGTVEYKDIAQGAVGANFGELENVYYLGTSINYKDSINLEGKKTLDELKNTMVTEFPEEFKEDSENKNNGFPILYWQ